MNNSKYANGGITKNDTILTNGLSQLLWHVDEDCDFETTLCNLFGNPAIYGY